MDGRSHFWINVRSHLREMCDRIFGLMGDRIFGWMGDRLFTINYLN
ncbi:hypothetical protein [Microcoleus sp. CAWBG27]|nr:hypothetical protein [Microcoleus sp. CAWBG27]